jgi:hypothetical protein
MAKPVRQRVQKWREKKSQQGGRSLSVWLEPETTERLEYLLKAYGETASPLIARAIDALHQVTCNRGESVSLEPEKEKPVPSSALSEQECIEVSPVVPELAVQVPQSEADVILSRMKKLLEDGISLRELKKSYLNDWIRINIGKGVSYQEMADRLNEADIPTLTGKGVWEKGMIPTVLILSM